MFIMKIQALKRTTSRIVAIGAATCAAAVAIPASSAVTPLDASVHRSTDILITGPELQASAGISDSVSITNFIDYHNAPLSEKPYRNLPLDWSTDGCSLPVILKPFEQTILTPACWRHDFAYRNLVLQGRNTSNNRVFADRQFKYDMDYLCSATRNITEDEREDCSADALIYFTAVRNAGDYPTAGSWAPLWSTPPS